MKWNFVIVIIILINYVDTVVLGDYNYNFN